MAGIGGLTCNGIIVDVCVLSGDRSRGGQLQAAPHSLDVHGVANLVTPPCLHATSHMRGP